MSNITDDVIILQYLLTNLKILILNMIEPLVISKFSTRLLNFLFSLNFLKILP